MRNFIFSAFIAGFISLLHFSCANEVHPTGGPRDTIPPYLIHSIPETQSLNYTKNIIFLEFNEFIKADKLNSQLLITPTVASKYKVKVGPKKIQIKFEDDRPFLENTTYTFNFQNSIKDLTEGNIWENPKIVFSTGNYIDSLYIKGRVVELMTAKPAKKYIVSIYSHSDTLNALTGKPMYFTMTGEDGSFLLENLVSDTFKIYAFNDKNNNLIIDPSDEAYAFLPNPIALDSSVDDIELKALNLNISDIRLISARPIRTYFDITYNKSLIDYKLTPIDNNVNLYSNLVDSNKKIRIYNTGTITDSLQVEAFAKDSVYNIAIDTIVVKFTESRLPPEKLQHKVSPERNSQVHRDLTVDISFNKPIVSVNYDSLLIIYDSISHKKLTEENLLFNKSYDQLKIITEISHPSEENKEFTFYAAAGAFISAEGDSSSTINQIYKIIDPINFGSIHGSIFTKHDNFIIQLLRSDFKVFREIKNQRSFSFDLVPPGSYLIRILIDSNLDGEWGGGNILKNEPPEEVVFYLDEKKQPQTISLKANWEINDIQIVYEPSE